MIWKNKKVTLNNYSEVFKDYSTDTKEVIRSAILDSSPLEPYIKKYKDDAYKLWQIKLGLDEGLDNYWFTTCPSGSILNSIRRLKAKGVNIDILKDINVSESLLSENYYEYIIKWLEKGVALEKYDFSILPEDLLKVFDDGISLGYPMYIFNNGMHFTDKYIIECLHILSKGKSVDKFLKGGWDEEVLSMLSEYASSKYYDKLIDYITISVTPSLLEGIFDCCKVGVPLEDITKVDKDGLYIYDRTTLYFVKEAYINKYDYKQFLDVNLEDKDSLFQDMCLNSSRKLSGRLHKK